MLKRLTSITVAMLFCLNVCVCTAASTQEAQTDYTEKILFEENFETAVTYDNGASEYIIGRGDNVYNGWKTTVSGAQETYADDTVFSLVKDGENQVFAHSRSLGTAGTSGYSNTCFTKSFTAAGDKTKPVLFTMKMKAEPQVGAVQISFGGATWVFSHTEGKTRLYSGAYDNGAYTNHSFADNEWHDIKLIVDFKGGTYKYYVDNTAQSGGASPADGEERLLNSRVTSSNAALDSISVSTLRGSLYGTAGKKYYIDDIKIANLEEKLSGEAACEAAASAIEEMFKNPLTENVTLPSSDENGTTITDWTTSDAEVITVGGEIVRDYDEDKSATLTATVSNGDFSREYSFAVKVKIADPVYEKTDVLSENFETPRVEQTTLIAPGQSFNGWTRQAADTGTGFKYEIAAEDGADNRFLQYYHTGTDINAYRTFKKALTSNVPATGRFELSFKMKRDAAYNGVFSIFLGKAEFLFRMSHNYMYPGKFGNSANTAVATIPAGGWNEVRFVIDQSADGATYEYWLNGTKVTAGIPSVGALHSGTTDIVPGEFGELSMRSWTGSNAGSANAKLCFDDIKLTVYKKVLPDDIACKRVAKTLEKLFAEPLEENISLPLTGENNTKIEWHSDNEAVITSTGIITRAVDQNVGATLTASISRGESYSKDYSFTVTVKETISDKKACAETYEYYKKLFAAPLEEDAPLSTTGLYEASTEWASDNENVITSRGRITRTLEDAQATLTVVIKRGTVSRTESFTVTVKGIGSYIKPTQDTLQKIADGFLFSEISDESPNALKSDLNLITTYTRYEAAAVENGVKIEWTSSDAAVLSNTGKLTRAEKEAKAVTLTAAFKAQSDETIFATKSFSLTVLPKGEVYFYETFENPSVAAGTSIEKYNGWTATYSTPSATINVYDSEYTIEKETDENKVYSIYRPTSSSASIMRSSSKKLDKTIDGGEVSLRFRVMRKNARANNVIVGVKDSQDHPMMYNLEFSQSRIRDEYGNFSLFKMGGNAQKTGVWQTFEIIFRLDEQKFDCYHDGAKIAEGLPLVSTFNGTISSVTVYSVRNMAVTDSAMYVDDITLTQTGTKISDEAAASQVAKDLAAELGGKNVSEDFALETAGDYKTTILWESSNESVIRVINGKGIVTPADDSDTEVTLTARVIRGSTEAVQEIAVTVPRFAGKASPTSELLSAAVEGFTFDLLSNEKETLLTRDLTLPTVYNEGYAKKIGGVNVKWSTDKQNVVTNEGKITRQKYDSFLTLTAEFSAAEDAGVTAKKEFKIAVLAKGDFILNDGFDDAPTSLMNKTFSQTGKQLENGGYTKEISDGWVLKGSQPGMEMYTDTVLSFFPDNPYERVYSYTRKYRGSSAGVGYTTPNVTFTSKELDKEYQSGTLYASVRFYLTNAASRINMMLMDTKNNFSSKTEASCNVYYCAGQSLTSGELKGLVSLNTWHTMTFVISLSGNTKVSHRYDVFIDGVKVNQNQLVTGNGYPIYGVAVSSLRTSDGPDSSWYADDISIRCTAYDATSDVQAALSELTLPVSAPLTGNIKLPTEGTGGTRIVWRSSDENVISCGGKVYFDGKPHTVTLTATVVKDNVSRTKSFTVSVAGSAEDTVCEVERLKTTDGKLTGATVKNNGFSGKAALITLVYSKGDLREMRVSYLSGAAQEEIIFGKPIDTDDYIKYTVKAYVYDIDHNTIISNIYN